MVMPALAPIPVVDVPIDFGRNFPPPSPLVPRYLKQALLETAETDIATAVRFPRFMGSDRDRAAGAAWIAQRLGQRPEIDRIVMSNGTQSILAMLMAKFVQPGGTLLTEAFTYAAIKPLSALFGIKLHPVEIDQGGIEPDALDRACVAANGTARALYCMPTIHNPTSAIMSGDRRHAVAQIARRHNLQIFEDDIYGVLPEVAPPPLSTYAPERSWYILGLSKSLAAQLRVAYAVAPNAMAAAGAFWPGVRTTNWMVAPLVAEVATHWLERDIGERVLRSVRTETASRKALAGAILPAANIAAHPSSYHLWIELPAGWELQEFLAAARRASVIVGAGDSFAIRKKDGERHFRIGIGVPADEAELRRGLDVVADLMDRVSVRQQQRKG